MNGIKTKLYIFVFFVAILLALTSFAVHAETSEEIPETITIDGLTYYIQYDEAYLIDSDKTLVNVVVPATIEGYSVVEIREAFKGHYALENVTLPEGLKRIGDESFSGCSQLQTVNFPSTLERIGKKAFYNCSSLIGMPYDGSGDGDASDPDGAPEEAPCPDEDNWDGGWEDGPVYLPEEGEYEDVEGFYPEFGSGMLTIPGSVQWIAE